jgi:cytochrome c oxidase subunit 3
MGLIFILGQGNEYFNLNSFTPKTNAFGSVFYITTGFHGLHVLGGLIAFILLLARVQVGAFTPQKATSAIVVSYYWHFVDVVWIGLYSTIYLIQ